MSDANAIKAEANKAFSAKDYVAAAKLYSDAIEIDGGNHVLYSNRSASKAGQRDYKGALEDAEKCIQLSSSFAKGYARKGAALHGLRQYPEAVMAYEEGLQVDPNSDILKKGLADVKRAMDSDAQSPFGPGGDMGLGKIFNDPSMVSKLENHPKTKDFMKDPSFRSSVARLQASGGKDMGAMMGDPRMLTVLGVMMGIDIDAMERPEGSNETPPGIQPFPSSQQPEASSSKPTPPPAAEKKPETAPAPASAKEEPMEVEEETPDAAAQKEAAELKTKGNASYKARKFDEAIELYSKAWEVYPKDVTFLTNLSAVYFEKGEYEKCIETCEKAVEEGRDLRADYKVFAKAYGRIGSAYSKLGDLANAIKFYSKALTEHRTPDVLTKLREAEKAKAEADKQAYINPELADAARTEGNEAFKAGDFAGAVKHYTEAVKRLPTDPRAYNNRASCYQKLMALPEALKDAEQAIKIDGTFIKAYIRKALVQEAMKELNGALETLQQATEADTEKKHTRELETNLTRILQQIQSQRSTETDEETYERAMRDPAVQEIMSDPIMRQILSDAQQNPKALQDHMKNPMIAQKIQKLINAGIIRTR
ncbi:stress-induced-phosphoprotein 1 [Kwoniella mangroviensis CBS 10435]|uniref:Stress-induced-phosphoprotein 1 n=1 Tax=Kwoniella mangroviensis CBS 10435 TaxID=1331196 RepID=A0A1B9INY9_9TREE|nr:stress-induced-phosphoprotein 1 [Kwoniella mangroviensis CBS 10435]